MEPDFWLERWREGQTGFHQTRVTPLLAKYWPSLGLPENSHVLVPLCGKTLDMLWLADQGYQVTGVELSPLAIEQFFAENGLVPQKSEHAFGTVYHHNTLRIICADIFTLDAQMLSAFTGVYDRAALVALPPDMRSRYATHIYGQLAPGYKGLLITLEYDQSKMQGPPFSVSNEQIQSMYGTHSTARLIDRRDIIEKEPKFKEKGLERLDTLVFELSGKASKP